ncbi:UL16 [Gallid alphaherpesvirus 2]|uniref:UL16 n=1 Tax=Gallid alphaherpesvirus 2 TaxID=10390 RepID=Q9IBV9_9ALPH|nr:UL16 [Gallid alphaherpesvirus 2]
MTTQRLEDTKIYTPPALRKRLDGMDIEFVSRLNERYHHMAYTASRIPFGCMLALIALDSSLCTYVTPNKQPRKAKWVEIFMYLTRPKNLYLSRKEFHILFLANGTRAYSVTATLRIHPILHEGSSADVIFFSNVSSTEAYAIIPDVTSEFLPTTPCIELDIDVFVERTQPPDDPHNCIPISIGVWWSFSKRRFYYLRMEESLLAICPAGWQQRSLSATLAKFINHESGCRECREHCDLHIDAYNVLWECGSFGHTCLCRGPCMWIKARQRDLLVEGDKSLGCVLFMDMVNSVRLITNPSTETRITERLEDVIVAGVGYSNIPVNSCGWHLVCLPEIWSAIMIQGCIRLTRLCNDRQPNVV